MGYYPQESLYKPYKYHGYTVRGTPNCPLINTPSLQNIYELSRIHPFLSVKSRMFLAKLYFTNRSISLKTRRGPISRNLNATFLGAPGRVFGRYNLTRCSSQVEEAPFLIHLFPLKHLLFPQDLDLLQVVGKSSQKLLPNGGEKW